MTLGWELLTVITSLAVPLDTPTMQFINIIVQVSVVVDENEPILTNVTGGIT